MISENWDKEVQELREKLAYLQQIANELTEARLKSLGVSKNDSKSI